MKLTKAKAKELCLIKWKYAMESGCTPDELIWWIKENHPSMCQFNSECAYCELYADRGTECDECPLKIRSGFCCFNEYSSWDRWYESRTKKTRKKYATIIYNDIKKS